MITSAEGSGNFRVHLSPTQDASKRFSIQVYYRGFRLSEYNSSTGDGHYTFEYVGATEASNINSIFVRETSDIQTLDSVLGSTGANVEVIDLGVTSA